VFRPETNVARFVIALVIIAKRLTTGFCGFLVEPAARKDAPRASICRIAAPEP